MKTCVEHFVKQSLVDIVFKELVLTKGDIGLCIDMSRLDKNGVKSYEDKLIRWQTKLQSAAEL